MDPAARPRTSFTSRGAKRVKRRASAELRRHAATTQPSGPGSGRWSSGCSNESAKILAKSNRRIDIVGEGWHNELHLLSFLRCLLSWLRKPSQ